MDDDNKDALWTKEYNFLYQIIITMDMRINVKKPIYKCITAFYF